MEKKVLPSFVVTHYKAEITDGGNNETRYSVLQVRRATAFPGCFRRCCGICHVLIPCLRKQLNHRFALFSQISPERRGLTAVRLTSFLCFVPCSHENSSRSFSLLILLLSLACLDTSHIYLFFPSSIKPSSFLCQVKFMLARRWTVIVLGVFVPTSMLLIIGYTTLFVNLSLLDVSSCTGDPQGRLFLELNKLFKTLRSLTFVQIILSSDHSVLSFVLQFNLEGPTAIRADVTINKMQIVCCAVVPNPKSCMSPSLYRAGPSGRESHHPPRALHPLQQHLRLAPRHRLRQDD